mgnify:CR=1 FL=1
MSYNADAPSRREIDELELTFAVGGTVANPAVSEPCALQDPALGYFNAAQK